MAISTKTLRIFDSQINYQKHKAEIDSAIQAVLNSGSYINGKEVGEFEKKLAKYLGVQHVIGCANGTDALQLAYMALNLEKEDEIILPAFGYVSVAECAVLLGLKPVFVDVNPDTFNIDVSQVLKAITSKTKAIVPIHLYGQCGDLQTLKMLAENNRIKLIEDNAQSVGSQRGLFGQIGTTSFFPTKNLGAFGDGGAVYTNDSSLAERVRSIANHGQKSKYTFNEIGINSRLDTIQAAILSVKLNYLDKEHESRKKNALEYKKRLSDLEGIVLPTEKIANKHIYHQFTIKVLHGKRDKLQQFLAESGIQSVVYYPNTISSQKPYLVDKNYPVAELLVNQVLSIPVHSGITKEDIQFISEKMHYFSANY
jgi:UDP-2-acetamido-2-deoxy-ribo-hexuluronate aminotransferase